MAKSEGYTPVMETVDPEVLCKIVTGRGTKSEKVAALRKIREIERATGQEVLGDYNRGVTYFCRNPSELARMEEERA